MNKTKSKNGGVDLVTILIGIVIFASVTVFVLSSIGNSMGKGTVTSEKTISNMLK